MHEVDEAKNLNVTIQQMSMEDDGIALSDIWSALKRGRVKLLAWLLIAVLVGGAGGVGYAFFTQDQLVATIVQFSYDGIEKGLDPKGAVFDANKMKSPQIVEPVLTAQGYVNDANVNAETVRQAVIIEGQVPQDVIDRLTVVTTIATNANAVSNLKEILDVRYYPTRFKVSLDVGALKLPVDAGRRLLDGMIESYREYFLDTYANVKMMGAAISGTDYTEYDYTEAMDVFNAKITTMMSYVGGLASRGNSFRSVATGYTFADINASLDIIRTTDLSLIDSLIYSYNLTKDKDLLLTRLDYQLEDSRRQLGVTRQTLDTINAKLASYEKDTVLLMGTPDTQTNVQSSMSMTLASTEYDSLIGQSIQATTRLAQQNAQINKLQSRIDRAQSIEEIPQAEFEKRRLEAEAMMESIANKLTLWVDIIEQTAEEYFLTEEFNDAFKMLVPSQSAGGSLLMSLVKYGLIGLVGACGVVFVAYVAGVCLGLAAGDKKRRVAQQVAPA